MQNKKLYQLQPSVSDSAAESGELGTWFMTEIITERRRKNEKKCPEVNVITSGLVCRRGLHVSVHATAILIEISVAVKVVEGRDCGGRKRVRWGVGR